MTTTMFVQKKYIEYIGDSGSEKNSIILKNEKPRGRVMSFSLFERDTVFTYLQYQENSKNIWIILFSHSRTSSRKMAPVK